MSAENLKKVFEENQRLNNELEKLLESMESLSNELSGNDHSSIKN